MSSAKVFRGWEHGEGVRAMFHQSARVLLISATVASSWLGMQVIHEAGHVAAAWWTGGSVRRVVLHPLMISRTDVAPNPRPVVVAWSGPVIGCVLPLLGWAAAHSLRAASAYLFQFFAGFCLVANGAYLGAGVLFPVGDARDLRAAGTAAWELGLFGAVSIGGGLWLWNGLGPRFGLGPRAEHVNPLHAASMLAVCLAIAVAELTLL